MGTVYVTQEDAFIGKTDERLTVKHDHKSLLDVPLIKVESIVVIGRATISPAAIIEFLERKISLTFLTSTGKFLGRLEPELTKNIFVRQAQWRWAGETVKGIHLVQGFVRGKLKNYRNTLLRAQREKENIDLRDNLQRLENAISEVDKATTIDRIRGLEGSGSSAYFQSFAKLILVEEFKFQRRERRPPCDPVNSLLSFGYALLRHDVQSAINIVGFDPYLGYLHVQHYGRPALALDLMEEFRPLVVDAVVLSAINRRQLTLNDFEQEPISNAVFLKDEGRKTFLKLYEQKKQSQFKHPVLQTKCTYREAFEIQARFIAKYLQDQSDKYPPLILK